MDQTGKTFTSEEVQAPRWMGRILIAVILGEAIWSLIVSLMNNLVVPWLGDVMGPSPGVPTSFTQRPYNYPDLFISVFEFCVAGLVAAVLNYFVRRPSRGRVLKVQTATPVVTAGPPRLFPQSEMSPALPSTTSSRTALAPEISVPERPIEAASPPAPPSPMVPVLSAMPVIKEEPVTAYQPVAVAPPTPVPPPVVSAALPTPIAVAPPAPVLPPPVAAKPPSPPPNKEPVKPKKPKEVYYNIVGEPMPSDDD